MKKFSNILEIQNNIKEQLLPLIDNDYLYLDLPYHTNIGDILIWEGTLQLLKQVKKKCLYSTSYDNFKYRKIPSDVIILLHGGGNFGDLWIRHHNFRKKIISLYKNNRIIILPQSVYYENMKNMQDDIVFYSQYKNVTICARDKISYDILKTNFNNNILLVPDMAFMLSFNIPASTKNKSIIIKRKDKELDEDMYHSLSLPTNITVSDWPSMKNSFMTTDYLFYIYFKILRICSVIDKLFHTNKIQSKCLDFLWSKLLKNHLIKIGIKFIKNYQHIYTTRLHIAILTILIGNRNLYIIDNKYKKTTNLLNTWFDTQFLNTIYFLENGKIR